MTTVVLDANLNVTVTMPKEDYEAFVEDGSLESELESMVYVAAYHTVEDVWICSVSGVSEMERRDKRGRTLPDRKKKPARSGK